MKLLLISNSFGVNLQIYAKQIAVENGFDLEIYTLFIGGCPLSLHDQNIKENNKAYELFKNGASTGKFVSIDEALLLGKWDYISLQQASHLSGDISSYYPYFYNVYAHVKEISPNSKIMFHKTWAYSGKNTFRFDEVKSWLPSFKFQNNLEMKNGIDEALNKVSKDYDIDLIIRSGDVVFEAMKKFDDVYDHEGFHLNELGCYLIGLNLVKSLFKIKTLKVYYASDLDRKVCEEATNFINIYF